jgi:hypothetical protein
VDRTGSGICPGGDFSVTSVKSPTSDSVVLVMIGVIFCIIDIYILKPRSTSKSGSVFGL